MEPWTGPISISVLIQSSNSISRALKHQNTKYNNYHHEMRLESCGFFKLLEFLTNTTFGLATHSCDVRHTWLQHLVTDVE